MPSPYSPTGGNQWPSWVSLSYSCNSDAATTASSSVTWNLWNGYNTNATKGTGTIAAFDRRLSDSIYGQWTSSNVLTVTGRFQQPWRRRLQNIEAGMTPEEREQRRKAVEAEEALRKARREKRRKEREVAILKAERLLRSCLSPEQEATLNKDHYFDVVGGKTGTKYRIRRGRHINIEVLGTRGIAERKLCFAPKVDCPDADAMLCQKLMLELDEDEALRVALRHSLYTGIQHGHGDAIVPQERRDEIIAEVVPIERGRRAA